MFSVPSCALTTVVTVFAPTLKVIAPEALPLVTAVPLTVTVAVASLTVGVKVMDETAFGTDAVYVFVAATNTGFNVPVLIAKAERLAFDDSARLIVTV